MQVHTTTKLSKSAQILVNNVRSLLISDRKAEDNTESERPVPNALIVR